MGKKKTTDLQQITFDSIFAAETPAETPAEETAEETASVKKPVKIIEMLNACDYDGTLCRKFTVSCKDTTEALQAVNAYFVTENKAVSDVLSQMIADGKTDFRSTDFSVSVIRVRPFTFVIDVLLFSATAKKRISEQLPTKSVSTPETETVKYIPTLSVRPSTEKMLTKFTPKTEAETPAGVKKPATKRRKATKDEIKKALEYMHLPKVAEHHKIKFVSEFRKGGLLDSSLLKEFTFVKKFKNGKTVIKKHKCFDVFDENKKVIETGVLQLAYQIASIKIKAAAGVFDKKSQIRFDKLTYKMYMQRGLLVTILRAYVKGDLSVFCPQSECNRFTDTAVLDLYNTAVADIYDCISQGMDNVAEIYNHGLNTLNRYIYSQSAYKGRTAGSEGEKKHKYTITSYEEMIATESLRKVESMLYASGSGVNNSHKYGTLIGGVLLNKKFKHKFFRQALNCLYSEIKYTDPVKINRQKILYKRIFRLFLNGLSVRKIVEIYNDFAKKTQSKNIPQKSVSIGTVATIIDKLKIGCYKLVEAEYPQLLPFIDEKIKELVRKKA